MYHHRRITRAATQVREAAEAQAAYSAAAQISATEIPGEKENPEQTQADKPQADKTQTDQTKTDQTRTDQTAVVQKYGTLNSKLTSYHLNEMGWSEENMPNLLFQLEPDQNWGLEPNVPYWVKKDGTNPTNKRDLKMYDYDFLPGQISIRPEPFRLEMYLGRLHSRCITIDLHSRMNPGPDESVPSPNAVNMSRMRLRNELNIPCWTKRRETPSQVECLIIEQVSWASMRLNTVLPVGAIGLLKPTCIAVDHSMAPFEYYDMPRDNAQFPHVIIPFTTFVGEKGVHVPGPRIELVLNTITELQALAFEQGYPHWIFLKNRDKPKSWSYKARMQHHANSGPNDISVPAPQALPKTGLLWIEYCIQKAVESNEMHLPLDNLTKATREWVESVITWAKDEIEGVPEVEITGTRQVEPDLASAKAEDNHEWLNGAGGWAGDATQETPLPKLDLAIATAADIREWLQKVIGQASDEKPELITTIAQPSSLSAAFGIPTAHANATEVATERTNEISIEVPKIETRHRLTLDGIKASQTSLLTTEPDLNSALEMDVEIVGGWNAGAEIQIEVMELDGMGYNISAVLDPRLHETSGNMLGHGQDPPPPPYGQVAPVANMNRELDTYKWVLNQIELNQALHQDEGTEIRPYIQSEALMNEPRNDNPNLFPDLPQVPDHLLLGDEV